MTQPPGGSSQLGLQEEEVGQGVTVTPPRPTKPYRLQSSLELGWGVEEGVAALPRPRPRPVALPGQQGGVANITRFEKSCKVPPGGHTTALW